ncbi:hypothetical protein J6590_020816 [Homalodisca vitripennis]|nr:hypothetical protein J6590_020816 [Homalodisca vitripennis]
MDVLWLYYLADLSVKLFPGTSSTSKTDPIMTLSSSSVLMPVDPILGSYKEQEATSVFSLDIVTALSRLLQLKPVSVPGRPGGVPPPPTAGPLHAAGAKGQAARPITAYCWNWFVPVEKKGQPSLSCTDIDMRLTPIIRWFLQMRSVSYVGPST